MLWENLTMPLHLHKTLYGSLVPLQKLYVLTTAFSVMHDLALLPSAASSPCAKQAHLLLCRRSVSTWDLCLMIPSFWRILPLSTAWLIPLVLPVPA